MPAQDVVDNTMSYYEFTSGPLRDLSASELGASVFSDFELMSDSGHNRVYRAMADGKRVVLKVAKEEEGNTSRNHLLLQREYDIMRAIDCLYVVKTWQMTDVPDLGRAIVMEYVAGRTLNRFLDEKPSWTERKRVAGELMEALVFLHERQTVHGDLKSGNILITNAGNHVRLIDFGFADTDAYLAKNIGTSPSIAEAVPEENEHLSVAKDIYALGKILEALFPGRMRMIVRRCCSVVPPRRYASVRQVRTAVHRYWHLKWLLPLLALNGIIIALVVTFLPHQVNPVAPVVVQTDTVVVITQPAADSTWLNVKYKAEKQYDSLYRIYADSLSNMPEKTMNTTAVLLSCYGNKMLEQHNQLLQAYPQYEEPLQELYISSLIRDHLRLRNICEDYPLIYPNHSGKK